MSKKSDLLRKLIFAYNSNDFSQISKKDLEYFSGWGGYKSILESSTYTREGKTYFEDQVISDDILRHLYGIIDTSFFTNPSYVKVMWQIVTEVFGFKSGHVLDPSVGSGRFIEYQPESVDAKWVAIDKDPLSARITQARFPHVHVYNKGFEELAIKTNSFDLIITNVPFGQIPIYDQVNCLSMSIHDYYLVKSARLLKDQGILAVVTSTGVLDKEEYYLRQILIEEKLHLRMAFRCPYISQDTEVTSDILFFQKDKSNPVPIFSTPINHPIDEGILPIYDRSCLWSTFKNTYQDINSYSQIKFPEVFGTNYDDVVSSQNNLVQNIYFWSHPECILGGITPNTMYSKDYKRVHLKSNSTVMEIVDILFRLASKNSKNIKQPSQTLEERHYITDKDLLSHWEKDFIVLNDDLFKIDGIELVKIPNKDATRYILLNELAEAYKNCIDAQISGSDEELRNRQTILKECYGNFVRKFGYINDNISYLNTPELTVLRALEERTKELTSSYSTVQKATRHYKMTDLFYDRIFQKPVDTVETEADAINLSLNIKGHIDLEYISELLGIEDVSKTVVRLHPDYISYDYQSNTFVDNTSYYSGNILKNIADVDYLISIYENGEEWDFEYKDLVDLYTQKDKLMGVLPPRLIPPVNTPHRELVKSYYLDQGYKVLDDVDNHIDIVNISMAPDKILSNFASKLMERTISVVSVEGGGYAVEPLDFPSANWSALSEHEWGTEDKNFLELFSDLLHIKTSIVKNAEKKIDEVKTLNAENKKKEIKKHFVKWLWENERTAIDFCDYYNDKFNSYSYRQYNGSHIVLRANANKKIQLRTHQKDGVWRIMRSKATLLNWVVGAGKTFAMIAATQELRKLNIIKRPMFVIPNATVEQFNRDYRLLYPTATVLVITTEQIKDKDKELLISMINTQSWDAIIISDSIFNSTIGVSPSYIKQFFQKELDDVRTQIKGAGKGLSRIAKRNYKRYLSQYQKVMNESAKANEKGTQIYIDSLAIDMLIIDEAHNYKNLPYITNIDDIAGLSASASYKALTALPKIRNVLEKPNGKVVFSTATPISNSIAELWTMQRYLIPDILEETGYSLFDNWIANFGEISSKLEVHHVKGMVLKTRIRKYTNRSEMLQIALQAIDVIDQDYLVKNKILDIPQPIVVNEVSQLSPLQQDYMKYLVLRAIKIDNRTVDPSIDNHLKLLSDGRKCVLDERLICSQGKNFLDSKVNLLITNVFHIWQRTHEQKGVQLIFCDESTPKKEFNIYDYIAMALVQMGVPSSQIAFIHDFDHQKPSKRAKLKEDLSRKANEGDLRIILGSTEKLGTGTNCQRRICAMHHASIRYRPSDIEQRNGRGIRQGNLFGRLLIFYYVAQGINQTSLDSFMWQIIRTKQEFLENAFNDDGIRFILEPENDDSKETLPAQTLINIAMGNPRLRLLSDKRQELDILLTEKKAHELDQSKTEQGLQESVTKIDRETSRLSKLKELEQILSDFETNSLTLHGLNGKTTITFSWEQLTQEKELRKKFKDFLNSNVDMARSIGMTNVNIYAKNGLSMDLSLPKNTSSEILISFDGAGFTVKLTQFAKLPEILAILADSIQESEKLLASTKEIFKLLSQKSVTLYPHLDKIEQLQIEVNELMAEFGDSADLEQLLQNTLQGLDLDSLQIFLDDPQKKVTVLSSLTDEELSILQNNSNENKSWHKDLEVVIDSWKGTQPKLVEAVIDQEEKEILDERDKASWEQGFKKLLKTQQATKIININEHPLFCDSFEYAIVSPPNEDFDEDEDIFDYSNDILHNALDIL